MTIKEFLAALPPLRERFVWYTDDLGQLRGFGPSANAQHGGCEHSTMTALAEVRTGQVFCCILEWDTAAEALGLSLEDATNIVSAEDQDSHCDPMLAKKLREAVGVTAEKVPPC